MTDPVANNVLVEALATSLHHGGSALAAAPDLLRRLLAEESWREFTTRRGEKVEHKRFADFVTEPPLAGLGSDISLIQRIVATDADASRRLRQILKEKPGPKRSRNNITRSNRGDTRAYALERLQREAPELHAAVMANELTPHAAMVQAGYRPRTITVPVTRPETVARSLLKHMSADDIAVLVKALLADRNE